MHTTPRPVRSLAFYTETVITDRDGPIEMFVEGNAGQGSSILAEKSRRSKHTDKSTVVVRGISLSTLLKETVLMTNHSHLIIKMDVEGAEYAILNNDWQSLCRAVEDHHVHVSLLLELHGRSKIGRNKDLTAFHRNKIIRKLAKCGVHIVMDTMLFPGWGRVYRSVTK
jgi:FkbM family methyltransferase